MQHRLQLSIESCFFRYSLIYQSYVCSFLSFKGSLCSVFQRGSLYMLLSISCLSVSSILLVLVIPSLLAWAECVLLLQYSLAVRSALGP